MNTTGSLAQAPAVSVNAGAAPLLHALLQDASALGLAVQRDASGATIVDAGIQARGGLEAGRRIALLCMAGLGQIQISATPAAAWPFAVTVWSSNPVLACLASQYAGWSLSDGEGKGAFRAMGSGPARALAGKEKLFQDLNYTDASDQTCLILEVGKAPPPAVIRKVCTDCRVQPERLTVILTPTQSMAGLTQIVSRVLEVALHKVHELGFALPQVADGIGWAPLPPPSPDFLQSMGRSNDAILFGGLVQLMVDCDDDSARQLAQQMPSSNSADYGRPFAETFKAVNYDFYKIDPMLFAPAQVLITNLRTGNSFQGGQRDDARLAESFGGPQLLPTVPTVPIAK